MNGTVVLLHLLCALAGGSIGWHAHGAFVEWRELREWERAHDPLR